MQTKDYIACKIKTGDSLKSLAERIGLNNYKQLQNFHNDICPKTELLQNFEITKGNTLYVPDLKEVISLNNEIKKGETNQPPLKPFKLKLDNLIASYDVTIDKTVTTGVIEKTNKIAYTLNLNYLINKDDLKILRVTKSEFYINKIKPQSKIQRLALFCSKAYYPMDLLLSKHGNIIGINNMPEIKKRWLDNKSNLEANFNGDYAEKYINNVNKKLLESNQLEKAIISDTVLNTLLLPYQRLNKTSKTVFNINYYKYHINLKVSQEVESNDTKNNTLTILQNGKVEDTRSYKDLLNPNDVNNNPFYIKLPKIEGTLNSSYQVNLEQELSTKIKAKYHIDYTTSKSKTTILTINHINN
ncbi:hypothetical protein [Psychroserpens sp. NJDZ02]|uniref:hypothetical protein n=1 Tax=Psychroserpens sp. NJDZ02 TaxID=2570561 RepID=UPI0010A8CE01|nr:hypothetical protein [Psychroserpens sp. NJDZ02]QCE42448.1 hypothetical protein E9099_13905 [Psychroserpens sp. NJDZ02]